MQFNCKNSKFGLFGMLQYVIACKVSNAFLGKDHAGIAWTQPCTDSNLHKNGKGSPLVNNFKIYR